MVFYFDPQSKPLIMVWKVVATSMIRRESVSDEGHCQRPNYCCTNPLNFPGKNQEQMGLR